VFFIILDLPVPQKFILIVGLITFVGQGDKENGRITLYLSRSSQIAPLLIKAQKNEFGLTSSSLSVIVKEGGARRVICVHAV
jgi:hypothetical protein